jgi:Uma2 family endonuclease
MATSIGSMTFAEFENLPDKPGKQELLEGELIALPPAKDRHSVIVHRIYHLLLERLRGTELEVRMETGYLLASLPGAPSTWVQPDVSIPRIGQGLRNGYLDGTPVLAIEVISDANRAADVRHKLDLYFEHQTIEVWLVFPDAGVIELHQRGVAHSHIGPFRSQHKLLDSHLGPIDPAELLK